MSPKDPKVQRRAYDYMAEHRVRFMVLPSSDTLVSRDYQSRANRDDCPRTVQSSSKTVSATDSYQ